MSTSKPKVKHLYDQIESIKGTICMTNGDRPELWIQRQNLQDLYHQIILSDIDFTIDKKLEQDLWNLVFKSQINYFQGLIKETRPQLAPSSTSGGLTGSQINSSGSKSLTSSASLLSSQKRLEAQASMFFFLEAARGFYTKLLEDIVLAYDFNELVKNPTDNAKLIGSNFLLPFCQRFPSIFDKINSSNYSLDNDKIYCNSPKEKQILYICQHILTHLGDIARYANLFQQAKNYYLHAIKLVPYLGHPYNQLGILFETSRTNQLSTIFYYMRSVACRYNFPLASTNMENFFKKLVDTPLTRYNPSLNNPDSIKNLLNNNEPHLNLVAKLSHKDLITLYLQINAMIYYMSKSIDSLATSPPGAGANSQRIKSYMELFKSSFTAFVTTPIHRDKLDSTQLNQMITILIFLIVQSSQENKKHQEDILNKDDLRSVSNSYAVTLLAYFVENLINLFNVPSSQSDLVMPALYIAFNFIHHYQDAVLISDNRLWTLENKTNFTKIFQYVKATVTMLNSLNNKTESSEKKFSDYDDYPLSEDLMLDSFLPFKEIHSKLNFGRYMRSRTQVLDSVTEDWVRQRRISQCVKSSLSKNQKCFILMDEQGVFSVDLKLCEMAEKEKETRDGEIPIMMSKKSLSINEELESSELKVKQLQQHILEQHASQPQQRKRRQNVAINSLESNKALLSEPPSSVQSKMPPQQHQRHYFHQTLNNQMNIMQNQNSNMLINPMLAGTGIPINRPAFFNPPLLNDPPPMFQNHSSFLRTQYAQQNTQHQPQQNSFFPSASQRQFQLPQNEIPNNSRPVYNQQANPTNFIRPSDGYSKLMPTMRNPNFNHPNNKQQNVQFNNSLNNSKNDFNFQQQNTHTNYSGNKEVVLPNNSHQFSFPNFQRDSSSLATPQQFLSLPLTTNTNNNNKTISSEKADYIDHLALSKSFNNIWTNSDKITSNLRNETNSNSHLMENIMPDNSFSSRDIEKLQLSPSNSGILTNILQQLNTNLFPNQSSTSSVSGEIDLATISLPNNESESLNIVGASDVDWSFTQIINQKENNLN